MRSVRSQEWAKLENLSNELEGIFKRQGNNQKKPPDTIYHYTAGTGFTGIIESGKLWLTDIFTLNDPSEIRYGCKCAEKILKEKAKSLSRAHNLIATYFSNALDKRLEDIADNFLCSFSGNGDDLGQWRAYADNGRGIAVGFDTPKLSEKFCKDAQITLDGIPLNNGEVFNVNYEVADLEKKICELIDHVLPIISLGSNLVGQDLKEWLKELLIIMSQNLVAASLYFKHPAYKHEEEYRFLEVHPPGSARNVQFRSAGHELVRYREFNWKSAGTNVLKEIIIGPAVTYPDRMRKTISHYLLEHGLDNVQVNSSEIPYRCR